MRGQRERSGIETRNEGDLAVAGSSRTFLAGRQTFEGLCALFLFLSFSCFVYYVWDLTRWTVKIFFFFFLFSICLLIFFSSLLLRDGISLWHLGKKKVFTNGRPRFRSFLAVLFFVVSLFSFFLFFFAGTVCYSDSLLKINNLTCFEKNSY